VDIEELGNAAIGAAIEVHRTLGPGLLESAYQSCLGIELAHREIPFKREVPIPFEYRGQQVDVAYRIDFLVGGALILELKSVERLDAIHIAQVLTYLRLTRHKLALLINFNVPVLKQGIKRIIL